MDVLVRLNVERAAIFATYEMSRGEPAPANLSPATSTAVQVSAGLIDGIDTLLSVLGKAADSSQSPRRPFYEGFIRK